MIKTALKKEEERVSRLRRDGLKSFTHMSEAQMFSDLAEQLLTHCPPNLSAIACVYIVQLKLAISVSYSASRREVL